MSNRPNDPQAAEEIYFDGGCPICRREIAVYRQMRGLESTLFTDVTAPDAVLPGIAREEALARFHVRRTDGSVTSGARAFLAVWRASPRLRRIAVILDRRPLVDLLELGYRAFLRVRPLWRRGA
ncbi:DUF393 domain-containing protein [Halovulum dunhuangense]|uniref:DUF393 domain-containing protein n=1 Tax=Halovulum dunhuangense TaxID=1505036 RepID=A0A849KQI4_9RHOB|nr:DUF393 domain-containing protein [Halovulum dunhuangense]NNU79333.1 DUF393 domain-containing protein [Halovulum dunhuangense]